MKRFVINFPLLLLFISCGTDVTTATGESIDLALSSDQVSVSTAQFEQAKMQLGGFEFAGFNEVIRTTGVMDVPPENKSTVSAYFGGYVKTISLLPGQKVKKGQTLFTLENPNYIEIQQHFLETKSELRYLKADYERQKSLSSDQISSQKTFLKAETDYEMTLARYESLKKKLVLMNINPNQITAENMRSTIVVRSPINGFITSVDASMGMFLNPSDPALTIMNTDHLHIELSIFEKNLSQIKVGQAVTFTVQNDPAVHQASVFLINHAIDPENRTVRVHCHLADESRTNYYTPGMFVEASIIAASDSALALPESAVVNVEDKNYVLVKLAVNEIGEYQFEKREVEVGETQNGYVQILNAAEFDQSNTFLTRGAFNLITE